jgi:hypothetical protein
MIIMKKTFLTILFFLTIACEKDFKKINTDPNTFSKIEPEYIFAGIVRNSINQMADMNKRAFWSYSHYLTVEGGSLPRYSASPGSMDGWWQTFYRNILANVNKIIVIFQDDPKYANRVLIAKIWRSYLYSVMVGTWGPIPYSTAFDEQRVNFSYDSEESIYADLLTTLKFAADNLKEDGDFFALDKVFPDHSILKWKKFANSLRLKIALQISDVNPSLAQPHIQELMANESMLVSNEDEDVKPYWGKATENYSPYYAEYAFDTSFIDMGTYPCLSHFLFLYLRAYKDPRISQYARPSKLPYRLADTFWVKPLIPVPAPTDTVAWLIQYPIPYYSRPKSARLMDVWHVTVPSPMPSSNFSYSMVNQQFLAADYYHLIISHVDVSFMKAEAAQKGYGGSKTAEEYYYEGIDASFAQYGLSDKVEDYKNRDGIKWGTSGKGYWDFRAIVNSSINGDPMVQIIVQRWIAYYFHGGFDAWCLQRRLRTLDLPPHLNPEIPTTTSNTAADLPERLPYPSTEVILNGNEMKLAVDQYFNGNNDMNGYLYFAKHYTRKNWGSMIPRLNNDAVTYWYGNTIAQLDSAGVVYDTIKAIKYRSVPH